jgi:cobaltochelatase CobT
MTHSRETLAATARAIARDHGLEIPYLANHPAARGEADHAALMHRHHNPALHARRRPAEANAAEAFDALEEARVEALGGRDLAGVRANLTQRFQQQSAQQDVVLAQTLGALAREYFGSGTNSPPLLQTTVERWRAVAQEKAAALPQALADSLDDQRAFANHALAFLQALGLLAEAPSPTPAHRADNASESGNNSEEAADDAEGEAAPQQGADSPGEAQPANAPVLAQLGAGEDEDKAERTEQRGPLRPNQPPGNEGAILLDDYAVFTTAHDQVIPAAKLATQAELEALQKQLEQRLPSLRAAASRLATRLQHLLLARQSREWRYEQEEGLLDNRRLARLVSHPGHGLHFKQAHDAPFRDTVITLLIDNSGSMRGRPIMIAALCADILAGTLERCGVKVEILGFTTRDWKGGQAQKDWVKAGRPPQPGRLNDLRHIVYKAADTPWRKARRALGLMLKDGVLKENIDGEAILWACDRLLKRPEQRRILLILSDGAPVDDSTLSANGGSYLDHHLRTVIAHVETRLPIELLAIGIGHDVTRYYKRAVTLSEVEKLPEVMTRELVKLFAEREMSSRMK